MVLLASIDSDESDDQTPDDMEFDCVIRDEDGRAIGETRRLRPPLANADYSTPGDSNMRLIKNIGHDPHVERRHQKETRAARPRSDLYDGVGESRQVAERIASDVTERVSKNRTGETPALPEQDAATLPFMNGFHDMRAVSERGARIDSTTTRRALTETNVRSNDVINTTASSAMMRVIHGVYDKITHGFRHDKVDNSTRLPSADTENRMRTVSSMREYDPNRGKANSVVTPRPSDAHTIDHARLNAAYDHISYERTSLVLPIAGYGQIAIQGTWNSSAPKHDRLEHELIEVEVAEMEVSRGQLVACIAHPAHPNRTGFDGFVRTAVNIAPMQQGRGQVHAEIGRSNAASADRLIRPGTDVSAHEQRFGRAQQATTGISHTETDGIFRAELDASSQHKRFGVEQQAALGPLNPTASDSTTRIELDLSSQHQRSGQSIHATAGPLLPSTAGFDALHRQGADASKHMQRMGVESRAAIGPLQPTASDATTRTELDATAHLQRLGAEAHTMQGPLQPPTSGQDAVTRTELDAGSHMKHFGRESTFSHPTELGSIFDGTSMRRPELGHESYSRQLGQVGMSASVTATQSNGAFEGRSSRVSPLNSNELSRGMTQSSVYQGSSRQSVDADRLALSRAELSAGMPTCGAHSTITAAAMHTAAVPEGIRFTKRAMYEENQSGDFAADLSWVSHATPESTREASHAKAPDSLSMLNHPSDTTHTVVQNTSLAKRDAAPKKPLKLVDGRQSAAHEYMFTKLPVIYESRRRLTQSTEIEPLPPASEFAPSHNN